MVYMRGQVVNSKCMDSMWYECEGGLIIVRENSEGWS